MRKLISILVLTLTLATVGTAVAQDAKQDYKQARKEKWEKFRQDKQAFFTKTMELSDEQASKFFPLFDEMEKKKFELAREVRHEERRLLKSENVTDEQYKVAADRAASLSAKEVAIEKEYYAKFCEILTPRQQFLYHRCEHLFQKEMIDKHHKGNKPDKERK